MYLPEEAYLPAFPAITCCPNCRSTKRYLDVVRQFKVATHPRYVRRDADGDGDLDTFCNVFVTDVADAMGCYLPHWHLAKEFSANRLVEWLTSAGKAGGLRHGWEKHDAHTARGAVMAGIFTIAGWRNPAGVGHVAVVLPIEPDDERNPYIAQAGRINFVGRRLSDGFGLAKPDFYTCR